MTKKLLIVSAVAALLALAGPAQADTSIGGGMAAGDDGSAALNLNVRQTYDPLVSTSIIEIQPFAELGVHYWTDDDSVWGASLAPGIKVTLFTTAPFQPYLVGSVGGAINTDDHFESRDLGSNLLFRTQGAVGVQFGEGMRHRIQGEYTNYSTWGITDHDDGYNTYGVGYGYSF